MAFELSALTVASNEAVQAIHKNIAKLSLFAKNFSELNGQPGNSIQVPIYNLDAAAEFNATSNNYCTDGTNIGAGKITLDQHYVKSVSITDVQEAETGIRWV